MGELSPLCHSIRNWNRILGLWQLKSHSGSLTGPLQNVLPCVHGIHGVHGVHGADTLIICPWTTFCHLLCILFILFFYCVCHMTVCACGGQKFTLAVFLYGSLLEVPRRIWPQFQDLIRTFLWFLGTQLHACVLGLPLFSNLAFPWPIFLPVRSWAVTDKGFCVKCVPLSVDTCLFSEWVLETWILLSVTNGRQEMQGLL